MANIKTTSDVRSYQNGRFIEESYLNGPIEDLKDVIDATRITDNDNVHMLPAGNYYWNGDTPRNCPSSVSYASLCVMECGEKKTMYAHDAARNEYYIKTFNRSWYDWEKLNNEPPVEIDIESHVEHLFRSWRLYDRSRRSANINYTNHRDVPIMVVLTPPVDDNYYAFYIDDSVVSGSSTENGGKSAGFVFTFIIPPKSRYKVSRNVRYWLEIY